MTGLRILDVRADMPVRDSAALEPRRGAVLGLAIHHSATASPGSGVALDTARSIFESQVLRRGFGHGAYHYLVRPNGVVEYALDEDVPGYHAGFVDRDDMLGLERGQFWNQHYLAVCMLGWFDTDRVSRLAGNVRTIPNYFTRPAPAQWRALLDLIRELRARYDIPVENVRGHRELTGCRTRCPGANVDLDALRAAVLQADGMRSSRA